MRKELLSQNIPLPLLLSVSGLWTAYQIGFVWLHPRPLGGDETDYNLLAHNILSGEGFTLSSEHPTAWRLPGLPLTLASIYYLFGENITSARVVLVIFTSLTSVALYFLADQFFDNK